MSKYISLKYILSLSLLALVAMVSSCDKDDKDAASAQVVLKNFGPSVLRGGELKFIGNNLNRVTAIILPDNVEVPAGSFKTHTASLIVIDVPEEAVQGLVILKTAESEITSKTQLSILEPITIESISPNPVRPGELITIKGTYLNLISMVEFGGLQQITEFETQTKTTLELTVPDAAQTAAILLFDDEEVPNVIGSEEELVIVLPLSAGISPNPIKAGSVLTIAGTNLDLATAVEFAGNQRVELADFVTMSATEITVNVPSSTDDGPVHLVAKSSVKTQSTEDLIMVVPTIESVEGVSLNVGKNNGLITVKGTNLDLVTSVTFGGGKAANVEDNATDTEFKVKIPADATEGKVSFSTAANKSVASPAVLSLVKPEITSFSPISVQTKDAPSITINGTNLDLVSRIIFGGGWEANVLGATATQIVIPVRPGSVSGKFTLITTNGTEILSPNPLTIVADVPSVTGPDIAFTGAFMNITGTNLNVAADVIFPGNIKATVFGTKSATLIEVFVPANVSVGEGKIKFVTYRNEIYESPVVTFKPSGVEPIVDRELIINDFDETTNHDLNWDNWGDNVELGSDPNIGISGKYLHGKKSAATGWTWIWACNHDGLRKVSVATADHYFKMDIKITKAIPANANFQMELGDGNRFDLGNLGGSTPNGGWITITFDLADFGSLPATIPASGEWGINLASGTVDLTGLYIDNIRFQKK